MPLNKKEKLSGKLFLDMQNYWDDVYDQSASKETAFLRKAIYSENKKNASDLPLFNMHDYRVFQKLIEEPFAQDTKKPSDPLEQVEYELGITANKLLWDYGYYLLENDDEVVIDQKNYTNSKLPFFKRLFARKKIKAPRLPTLQQIKETKISDKKVRVLDDSLIQYELLNVESVRASQLLRYYHFLFKKKQELIYLEKLKKEKKPFNILVFLFDVGKKFIDLIEDIWYSLRSVLKPVLLNAVGPFLTGGVGFIINFGEGYRAYKNFIKHYRNKNLKHRHIEMITSGAIVGLTGAGIGMSLTLVGAKVLNTFISKVAFQAMAALFPLFISGFLAIVYGIILAKHSYYFHLEKEKLAEAKNKYRAKRAAHEESLRKLKNHLKKLQDQANDILNAIRKLQDDSDNKEKQKLQKQYAILLHQIEDNEKQYEITCRQLQKDHEEYQNTKKKCRKLEREVALNAIEVSASLIVILGIILGTAFIVGNIASAGGLSMAITIAGVSIGAALKIFEFIDEHFDHKISKALRKFFKSVGNQIVDGAKKLFGYIKNPKSLFRLPNFSTQTQSFPPTPPPPPAPGTQYKRFTATELLKMMGPYNHTRKTGKEEDTNVNVTVDDFKKNKIVDPKKSPNNSRLFIGKESPRESFRDFGIFIPRERREQNKQNQKTEFKFDSMTP